MRQDLKGLGTYGTVGLEFGLSVLLGLFGGQWLDKKFGTAPWLTLFGLALGAAAGIRSLWRALKAAQREIEDEDRREREARRKYHERPPQRFEQREQSHAEKASSEQVSAESVIPDARSATHEPPERR